MKIGFIGLGNMADAMIGGIIGKGLYGKSDIIGSSKTEATAVKISEKYGIETCKDSAGSRCCYPCCKACIFPGSNSTD